MLDDVRFDAILNLRDPDFIEKFREATGIKPGDRLHIMTPQFDRGDGLKVQPPKVDFDKLHELSESTLKAIGCQKWSEPDANGEVLWLFPHEWYDHIPEGFLVCDINDATEPFKRGVTDDDKRCGALAYGFKRHDPDAPIT